MRPLHYILIPVLIFCSYYIFVSMREMKNGYMVRTDEEIHAAINQINEKIGKNPKDSKLFKLRGELYLKLATRRGAEAYMGQELKVGSQSFKSAEEDFETAYDLEKSDENLQSLSYVKVELLKSLSLGIYLFNDFRKGLESIKDFKKIDKEDPINKELLTWTEKYLKALPKATGGRVLKSQVLYLQGKKENAIQELNEVIKEQSVRIRNPEEGKHGVRYPPLVDYLYTRSLYRVLNNEKDLAYEDAKHAIEVWPHYADVYINRAFLAGYYKDKKQVNADLDEAIKQRPNAKEDIESFRKKLLKG